MRGILSSIAVTLLSCYAQGVTAQRRPAAAPRPPRVFVYDAVTIQDGLEITLRGVIVRTQAAVDTIPRVLTQDTPVLVGDTLVVGFNCDSSGALTHTFRYHVGRKTIDLIPAPPDVQAGLSTLTFSPNAHHIAYVRFADGRATAVVRSWPDGAGVLEGNPTTVYATDATGAVVGWESVDRAHFLILIPPGSPPPNRWWLHATADLRQRRILADTVVVTEP